MRNDSRSTEWPVKNIHRSDLFLFPFLTFYSLFGDYLVFGDSRSFVGMWIWYEISRILLKIIQVKELIHMALAGVAQWIECGLRTKGSQVQFPVRAHAWIAGQIPSGGMGEATPH